MDQLVTLRIDDREAKVPRGTLLVEAAKTVGIEVPVFCYHEKLKSVGACRMCLVEIEKMPKLQTACTTPVAEGMIVHTNSPKVISAQHSVIEFLLLNHPLDCPVCDKGGECPLQDNAFGWGGGISRYEDIKRHFVKPIDLSPEIKLDRERCIMCLRCVRFTKEIAGDESLVIAERGTLSEVATAPGRTFDSPFSGNTIEICPVGALTGSQFRFTARIWDLEQTPTICDKCPVGCNLKLQVRTNRLLRLWSRENLAVDDGWLCDRGRFNYKYVNSGDRLQQPLVRRGGKQSPLEPATWDEALGVIAESFKSTARNHGIEAVGGIGSARATNEEAYLFQKLFRSVLGTNNIDYTWRAHPKVSPLPQDAATGTISGLEAAGAILVIDANPIVEQPILDLRIKKAAGKGAKVIVVGPERIDLAAYGTHLAVPAAKLAALLDAFSQVILAEGIGNADFLADPGAGSDALGQRLGSTTLPARAAELGLATEAIGAAARLLAAARAVAVLYRRDLLGGGAPVESRALATSIYDLTRLVGAVSSDGKTPAGTTIPATRPGSGVYPLGIESNEQGCIDLGLLPDRLPGQRAINDETARAEIETLWGTALAPMAGKSGAEMVNGGVRALYIIGQDPLAPPAGPAPEIAAGLAGLDFLVVQDAFLTETAKLADVVLPGVTFAERDGTYTNLERRVQRLQPGVRPPGSARMDWAIVRDVANALGGSFDYAAPQEVMAELAVATPIYHGMTYSRIGDKGLTWPRPSVRAASAPVAAESTSV